MSTIACILVCSLIAILASPANCGRFKHIIRETAAEAVPVPGITVATFSNRVDHFNLASRLVYEQRYWHTEAFWDRGAGPMVLYIHGEGPGYVVSNVSAPAMLASKLKAKLFLLEHRFYGTSQPCADWSLSCLRLLTHDQALADIAHFIQANNRKLPKSQQKWLLIGGSYAGALAVWFKLRYPHLAAAVYASSATVAAVTDYRQYMGQVYTDLAREPKCLQTMVELNAYADGVIAHGDAEERRRLKAAMGADMLDDLSFLEYFSDIYVGEVQASRRKNACQYILALNYEKEILAKVARYARVGKMFYVEPSDYTFALEKNTTINPQESSRQWMYQTCTAFGYFQTGSASKGLRSPRIDAEYWKSGCQQVFGAALFPVEAYANSLWGDLRTIPHLKKTAITCSGDDPWQWAAVRDEKLSNDQLLVKVIECDDCAHCSDLLDPELRHPRELVEAREKVQASLVRWMRE